MKPVIKSALFMSLCLAASFVLAQNQIPPSGGSQIQLPAEVTKGWDLVWAILTGKWVLAIVVGLLFAAAFQLRAGKMNLDAVKQNAGALVLLLGGPAMAIFLFNYFR